MLKYVFSAFATGFILSLAGITFEDTNHNIAAYQSLSVLHHFIAPLVIGSVSGIIGFLIWKRKVNQIETINKYTKNLYALLDVNSTLITTLNLEEVLQIIIDESTHLTNLDTGAIYLHENENLYLGATTPPLPTDFPEILRFDFVENHPHIQKTLSTKKAIIVPDTRNAILSESESLVVKMRRLRSIIYIPLIVENRSVGTLILGTTQKLRTFTKQEIDIYGIFSVQAALTIDNARLYKKSVTIANELRQQNEEFLVLNEELSESYERIQKINEDLTSAKIKAEESDKLKSAFLLNMSHEVRTPLNAITGFSTLMTEPDLSIEKRNKYSEMISISSDKLIGIITDIIEMSQIHANQMFVKFTEIDIREFTHLLQQCCTAKAKQKNIELRLKFNIPNQNQTILSDFEKLKKILTHLTDNALKFTVKGYVEIACSFQNQTLEFAISDTGIGISEEMQKIIFDPFRQAENGLCRNFGGNGLGLSIVKAYTELLNGSLIIKSEINKGTTITVSFPVEMVSQEKIQKTVAKQYHANTVLIVDDEYSNYYYLAAVLEKDGLKILYADNGQKAIDMCRANSVIDLIFMDIKMPIMDGHTAAKLIKTFRPDIPIIAQTAFALESEKEDLIGVFDHYITKPINKRVLSDILHKYTKH